jgi:preprotein translocase subunit SecA
MLAEWARAKFAIKLDISELVPRGSSPEISSPESRVKRPEIIEKIKEKVAEKYKEREIEYPVEFAMNMAYGPQGPNIYGYEALAKWANKKYKASFSAETIQEKTPRALHRELLDLSTKFNDGELEQEISEKAAGLDKPELIRWANERFDSSLTEENLSGDNSNIRDQLSAAGREFLRAELSDLEKYVLIQVYDSAWKDHLYSMDHLKSNVWMRSFAEKDPKVEYKQEGYKMFEEMLETIEDRVTDIIFKVHLEAGARARDVWNVSGTSHDEVGQFAMAESQRAAAQAPQGETKVKQIKLETPKVGRNDPCPCGSGKKYKKCHGQNA